MSSECHTKVQSMQFFSHAQHLCPHMLTKSHYSGSFQSLKFLSHFKLRHQCSTSCSPTFFFIITTILLSTQSFPNSQVLFGVSRPWYEPMTVCYLLICLLLLLINASHNSHEAVSQLWEMCSTVIYLHHVHTHQ